MAQEHRLVRDLEFTPEDTDTPSIPPPAEPSVLVHYRDRDAKAPYCDPTLKGRPGHVMGRTWKDLQGDDGKALHGARKACIDCLKKRGTAAAEPKVEVVEGEVQADPNALKAQLRQFGPRLSGVALFRAGRPPLNYIKPQEHTPGGDEMLGMATDSIVDVLDHYDLLGPAVTSPALGAAINVFGLLFAVRALPRLDGVALRRAHGMAEPEEATVPGEAP